MFAVEILAVAGAVATVLGSLGGVLAFMTARSANQRSKEAAAEANLVANRTATREETQQALDAQGVLIERQDRRILYLEARNAEMHTKLNDVLAEHTISKLQHKNCEKRLAHAEARIAELGG